MPKFKNPRADARAEQDVGERPHSHKHTHEAGAQPHEHTWFTTATASGEPGEDLVHQQRVSGAGPDAGSALTDLFNSGLTAPLGSSGFSLAQHLHCLTPEQREAYPIHGGDVLPEACRRGHAPR